MTKLANSTVHIQMSDDKYTSELYKTFKGDSVSPEEAKWNLMHSMHAVYSSAPSGMTEFKSIILDLYFKMLDLKVHGLLMISGW